MGSRATSRATTPIGNLANGYLDEFIIETSTNVAAASQLTVDGESGLGESEIIEPVPDWFNLRCHKPYCPAEKDNKDVDERGNPITSVGNVANWLSKFLVTNQFISNLASNMKLQTRKADHATCTTTP
jgi:hypothetical protein